MKVTNCCGALFLEPGYPDSDICCFCKEHADAIEEEELKKVKVPDIHRRGYLIKKEFKNTCDEIKSLKKDILKMIDAIEKNEMHIQQLNWKIKNHEHEKLYDDISKTL